MMKHTHNTGKKTAHTRARTNVPDKPSMEELLLRCHSVAESGNEDVLSFLEML